MNENFSLTTILRNDPDFSHAFTKKRLEVKKDKENLLDRATKYTKKYEKEIEEGEKKRQKLLEEGKSKGLKEDEIFKGNTTFYPTVRTPILNFLYFMLRDEPMESNTKTPKEVLMEYIENLGYDVTEEIELYIDGITQNFEVEKQLDEDGDNISFEDTVSEETTEEVEEIGEFLYGKLTTTEFKRIKKLKALSKSENEEEAFQAYRKAMELCRRHNLEFDKIPCEIK